MAGSSSSDGSGDGGGALGRIAAVLLGLAAVAVIAWLVLRGGSDGAPAAEPESPPAPAPAAAAPAPPAPPLPPEDELPGPVRAYLEQTVYPPDSGRLDQAGDILEANPRFERFKRVPGSHGADPDIEFLWTADAFRYTSDQTARARFEARQGELAARVHQLDAWAQAEDRSGAKGDAVALTFRREGDAWLADLDLSKHFEEHLGFVVLGVRYTVADVAQQQEQIRIFVTPADAIPAAFTGEFRSDVVGGSLEVEVGLEVYEPGFYRFDANLFGPGDAPIAWAAHKGELSRSDGAVRLRFFGRVLHDLGRGGPYEMRQLRGYLFRDGEFPDRIHLRDYPGTYTTSDFALADFSDAEWDSEHKRHMIELMLQDEAAGISIDVPAPAAESDAPAGSPPPPGP